MHVMLAFALIAISIYLEKLSHVFKMIVDFTTIYFSVHQKWLRIQLRKLLSLKKSFDFINISGFLQFKGSNNCTLLLATSFHALGLERV